MKIQLLIKLFLLLLIPYFASSQKYPYPKTQFRAPIDRQLNISGNFAELRGNHFHSGIDLRIGEREGEKVYSPEEGEVSRIKIQAYGGGKNLYIRHINGYTTVYMHLQNFSDKIEKYVKEYQYEKQTYEFDLQIPKGKLKLKKGELIAYAGNTGSSGGPHLHYEIRDTKTENIINPQHFGIEIKDTIAPNIISLLISPEGDYSRVEGINEKQTYKIIKPDALTPIIQNSKKQIKQYDTINVTNQVSFGIIAFDKSENSTSRNGIYSYNLNIDDNLFWQFKIDEFSFFDSRYINACIDYEIYSKTSERYLITKKLPNNQFQNFYNCEDGGIITMEPNAIKKIEYQLQDFKGNTTTFIFYLQSTPSFPSSLHSPQQTPTHIFQWDKDNKIEDDQIQILVPKNSLYDNIPINYSKQIDSQTLVPIFQILSPSPLHNNMTLQIQIPNHIKDNSKLTKKLVVASLEDKYIISIGGKIDGDKIIAKTKNFGTYTLKIDTIAPTIAPKNFKSNKPIKPQQKALTLTIRDNLSSVAKYNAYINNKWVLMEYDGKSSTLIYNINPEELNQKTNTLKVEIEDKVGNKKQEIYKIVRR